MSKKDESLIITEVDRLITTISEAKRITLEELQQVCKIDKKSTDKWVRVLEDEGYVNIEYKLGATYIVWKSNETQENTSLVSEKESEEVREIEEKTDSVVVEIPKQEEANQTTQEEPEALAPPMEEEIALTKIDTKEEDYKVKTSFEEKESEEKIVERPQKTEEIAQKIVAKEVVEVDEEEIKSPTLENEARDTIAHFIKEINQEKELISKYKLEKQALHQEKIINLERKVESDLGAITELILEKQGRIAKIKESVANVPNKIDQIQQVHEQILKAKEESQKALNRLKNQNDIILEEIEENKNEMEAKLNEIEAKAEDARERLAKINGADRETLLSINALEERAAEIEKITKRLDENLSEIRGEVAKAKENRSQIKEEASELENELSEADATIESIKTEIEELGDSREVLDKYMEQYQQRAEELEKYVDESEEELAQLKESAESHYLKGYAQELEKMAESYSSELSEIVQNEEEIDEKIARSKKKIIELIKNSQEIMEKLNSTNKNKKEFSLSQRAIKKRIEMIKTQPPQVIKSEEKQEEDSPDDDDKPEPAPEKVRIGRFERKGPIFSSAAKRIAPKKDKN